MPDHFLTDRYPTGLEELFTVVWWEQRGTGLSYHGDIPAKTMTVNQFVSDTLAVTNYLRSRFGKAKIYLMGHSWGSFIGIQAAAQAPELFYAYIGMAQMSYQLESEKLAYEFMIGFAASLFRRNAVAGGGGGIPSRRRFRAAGKSVEIDTYKSPTLAITCRPFEIV